MSPAGQAPPVGPDAQFAACALNGDPHAADAAREFTRSTLNHWGMAALVDDAAVVVSEMLSNAIRYGLDGRPGPPVPERALWVGLLRNGSSVLCTVSDPSTDIPVVKEPDYLAEAGRGPHIIDSLSESWGWTQPDAAGKSVWAMISGT